MIHRTEFQIATSSHLWKAEVFFNFKNNFALLSFALSEHVGISLPFRSLCDSEESFHLHLLFCLCGCSVIDEMKWKKNSFRTLVVIKIKNFYYCGKKRIFGGQNGREKKFYKEVHFLSHLQILPIIRDFCRESNKYLSTNKIRIIYC